jgi:hypothetical protein
MKRATLIISLLSCFVVIYVSGYVLGQDSDLYKKDKLMSKQLEEDGNELDKQILSINQSIQGVIADNNLLSPENKIKLLPYQVSLVRGKDFIAFERHKFIRSGIDSTKIVGIQKKSLKVTLSGKSASKIESVIFVQRYDDESITAVNVTDPSPNTVETRDMKFEYKVNENLIKDILLEKVQNTTAFPIRNDLKRNFLIPHLTYFYSVVLNIAETYKKGIKDADSLMADFLKESTSY